MAKRYRQGKPKPLRKGAVIARCIDCGGLALADGKGSAASIEHADDCPNRVPRSVSEEG